jgi:dTDP-3,4-didehydro-2,6-dideoxy-alpha-D-glucose 3-reductase
LNILILGYSNIFKKRLRNVLIKNKINFSVASNSSPQLEKKAQDWFRSYMNALNNSKADTVYISLPNSHHYYWAKKALQKGFHVIVDKPICKNYSQAKNLVTIARKKNKLIAEATFFNYHKQFTEALKILKGPKNIQHISTSFIIPQPKKKSILMSKKLSGGCFMDMAPYAVAVPRIFCQGKALSIKKNILKNKKGLVISFNILCRFKNTTYQGFFCFGGEYKSSVTFFTKDKYLEINRVFSPPPNKNLEIKINKKNKVYKIKLKKEDVFENFLRKIRFSLGKKNYKIFYDMILDDAKFKDKIILAK